MSLQITLADNIGSALKRGGKGGVVPLPLAGEQARADGPLNDSDSHKLLQSLSGLQSARLQMYSHT